MKYVLLLRGINVGTSIRIAMKELKLWLEEINLKKIVTYLNSGNVIFESELNAKELTEKVDTIIKIKCKKHVPVLIKSSSEIISISKSIPEDWRNDETQQTYVAYLFDEVADENLLNDLPIKKEYVDIYYKDKAIIWNIKRQYYNKSQITKLVNHSAYEYMTTRNVNTARKLAELCM